MSGNIVRTARLKKELGMFAKENTGFSCYPQVEDVYDVLIAQMEGPDGSPYEGKTFKLRITIPTNYPHDPPLVQFITPVYHPNIDSEGRICLKLLTEEWKSCNTLLSALMSIKVLLESPNLDDPLMENIANEYKYEKEQYLKHAKERSG